MIECLRRILAAVEERRPPLMDADEPSKGFRNDI